MDLNQAANPTEETPQIIQQEIEKLERAKKKQEQRIQNLETKAIQNVNLYFIFQAVVLSSTTFSTNPACKSWWIPFTLSLFAAIANLSSLFPIGLEVLNWRNKLDQEQLDLQVMKYHQMKRDVIDKILPGTSLIDDDRGCEILRPKASSMRRWKRHATACLFSGLVVGFSGVVMYGCYSMLCHYNDRKCVKLC